MFIKFFIVVKLLFRSNALLLRLAIWILPLSVTLAIGTLLFVDNTLVSYEEYLKKCYIGYQGRVSILAEPEFLDLMAKESDREGWKYSARTDLSVTLNLFYKDTVIVKSVKAVILDDDYFFQKFNKTREANFSKNHFVINTVFQKGVGNIKLDLVKRFKTADKESIYELEKISVIDTGFLTDEPLLFLAKSYGEKLFDLKGKQTSVIEFLEFEEKTVTLIKQKMKELSRKVKASHVKVKDLLYDTKESKDLFEKIYLIESAIVAFVLFLALCVIYFSMTTIISFKRNSLAILRLLGISIMDIIKIMVIFILMVYSLSLCLGVLLMNILRGGFLKLVSMPVVFIAQVDRSRWAALALIGILFIVAGAVTTKSALRKGI